MWLLVVLYITIFGERPAKKKPICAKMKIKPILPILSYVCKMWEKSGFSNITHIIVAMYFTTFEGLIVHRNTCYVSKRSYSCRV